MSHANEKQSVALSSVSASAFLTIMKLGVGLATGSMGILSEAIHSLLDLGAAVLTYIAVKVGDRPADTGHHYGYGKIESVSALIETGLLFVTSGWIIYESVKRLVFSAGGVEVTWYAFAVMLLSVAVDWSRSRALNRVAKETHSQALEADALHFSSDILSSLVVLVGLLFVRFGFEKADAVAALGVSLFVIHAGYSLGKRTLDVLIDAAPAGLTEKITEIVKGIDDVVGIEKIRVRPAGAAVFVDMTVTISRKISLERADAICDLIEEKVNGLVDEADVVVHTQPLQLSSETIIEQVQLAALNNGLQVHDIAVHSQDDKIFLSYDLEVDGNLALGEAHTITSELEGKIKNEIGKDVEINTHIEPLRSEIIRGNAVAGEENERITKVVKAVAEGLELVKEVHNIQVREAEGRLFLSLHCVFEIATSLEDTHQTASRYEYLIRKKIPQVQRAVIHVEPMADC